MLRGRLADIPDAGVRPVLQNVGIAAAVTGAIPLLMRIFWSMGVGNELHRARSSMLSQAAHVPFTVAALAGVLLLGFGRASGLRLLPVLAAVWLGSGVRTCWAAWVLLDSGGRTALATDLPGLMHLVLSLQLAMGVAVTVACAMQLAIHARVGPARVGATRPLMRADLASADLVIELVAERRTVSAAEDGARDNAVSRIYGDGAGGMSPVT